MLLRESFREDGKVKKRTLANLSKWPDDVVRGLRILLEGGVAVKSMEDAFEILRCCPHGHLTAVLGTARTLGLEKRLDRRPLPDAVAGAGEESPAASSTPARSLPLPWASVPPPRPTRWARSSALGM